MDLERLWQRFDRDGVCSMRMDGALDLARNAPGRLVEQLCGSRPLAIHVDDGQGGECHPYLPAPLQIFACEQPPGGSSVLVDIWQVLAELRERGSPLFEALFDAQRVIKFGDFVWCAPTLSLRAGHLVCVHGTPLKSDPVGNELEREVAQAPVLQCELEAGDLMLVNNHRMLHAGARERVIRILVWLEHPFPAPDEYVRRATRVARRTQRGTRGQPAWIRKRLGTTRDLYEPADLLGHYRGELREDISQQAQLIRAHARATGYRSTPAPEPRA